MSKLLDATPISVQRSRRSNRIEILYNADGTIDRAIAHRVFTIQQAGVDIMEPFGAYDLQFINAVIPATVRTQLIALGALVDSNDP